MVKAIEYWELYIDGDLAGYIVDSTPQIEHGYMMCFADTGLTTVQGVKEAYIQHWRTVPVEGRADGPTGPESNTAP